MKIYKVHFYDPNHESYGYGYFTTRKDALNSIKVFKANFGVSNISECKITKIISEVSEEAIMELLNKNGSHPDNG